MISKELAKAREYEAREGARISKDERPAYHLTARIGWLNDPNGFSYYDGKYHLFYQYHPYDSFWGPMHWGHVISDDMIRWEYLPAAMAPDHDYDGAGCFSGSLLTLKDGRQLIMYTGCANYDLDPTGKWRQTQCIALRDGDEYVKYEGNPVIRDEHLPEDGDIYEFRDPYLWIAKDGSYRSLVANASKSEGEATQLTVYRSDDGFTWERDKVIFEDFLRIGIMWECPNLFELDGSWVLIASPMDMEAEEAEGSVRFPKGSNVCYILGDFDEETSDFRPYKESGRPYASYHPVDCGLDFYAPQIRTMPDGRRIMLAWMQDPKMGLLHDPEIKVFGQLSVPRELSLKDGKLYQWPVRELEAYRQNKTVLRNMEIGSEETELPGIRGRVLDLELDIDASECREFVIRFANDGRYHTDLRWRPEQSVVTIDRSESGQSEEITKRRAIRIADNGGHARMRILLDRWSVEIFVNDGEQVLSTTIYTDQDAEGITFRAEGTAKLDAECYTLEVR